MVDAPLLHIDGLSVSDPTTDGTHLVDDASVTMAAGEVHAITGLTSTAGSALVAALLGWPSHRLASGRILFRGDDITTWPIDVRANAGLFLAFDARPSIGGVTILSLLRQAVGARKGVELNVAELRAALVDWMARLGIDPSFMARHLDQGLSAADSKRSEILQMAVLEPDLVILDEPGPTIDDELAQTLARGIRAVRADRPSLGTLAITQSQRLIDLLEPDRVHVMVAGRIVASGGPELAIGLDSEGYESFT